MSWKERAACEGGKGINWFPQGPGSNATFNGRRNLEAARKLCADCPVKGPCLEAALAVPDTVGIWAGTTAQQRAAMRRTKVEAPINHGTQGGYQTHRRRGEEPCQACMDGNARAKFLYRMARKRAS